MTNIEMQVSGQMHFKRYAAGHDIEIAAFGRQTVDLGAPPQIPIEAIC